MTSRFWLDLCRIDQSKLSLSFREFEVLELNGRPASDPSIADALRKVETMAAAIPTMFIDSTGTYAGVEDPEKLLLRMEQTFPERNFDNLRATMQLPSAALVFESAVGKYWTSWVGGWLSFDPSQGARQAFEEPVPGTNAMLKVEVEFGWDDQPGFAHLTRISQGNEKTLAALMAGSTGALGGEGHALPAGVKASLETRLETVTAWPDIRPRTASFRNATQMEFEGKTVREVEQHEYSFDWSQSKSLDSFCPPQQ